MAANCSTWLRQQSRGETLRAERIDTSLEDVFIYMMSRSADNVRGEP